MRPFHPHLIYSVSATLANFSPIHTHFSHQLFIAAAAKFVPIDLALTLSLGWFTGIYFMFDYVIHYTIPFKERELYNDE